MSVPIASDLRNLEQGIEMYDAHLQQEVLAIAPVLLIMADNPRHSELLNHLGSSARRYCRMCMVSTNKALFFMSHYMYIRMCTFSYI